MQMCFIFYFIYFLTVSQKKCLGEWTLSLWHCCISRKFSGYMYARQASVDMDISMDIHGKSVDMDMNMDGKFHIHDKPGKRLSESLSHLTLICCLCFVSVHVLALEVFL